ncbi:MAG: hypothetical protein H5T62_09480, partial [Anaerolineae bacterium]|nr:hypothetical protein [Anaerolineae bacterium]
TQHPTKAAFGDDGTMPRNLVGRMALRVTDAKASEVALGDSFPRADRLLGAGDAYVKGPQAIHRTQLVLVDEHDLDEVERQEPLLETWPEVEAEDLGLEPGRPSPWPQPVEVGMGLIAAAENHGRPWLKNAIAAEGLNPPGSGRAGEIMRLGQAALAWLKEQGWTLVKMTA